MRPNRHPNQHDADGRLRVTRNWSGQSLPSVMETHSPLPLRSVSTMGYIRRLRLLTGVLGAAATVVVAAAVFGDGRAGPGARTGPAPGLAPADPGPAAPDPARARLADRPALTYRPKAGPAVFAWQVKPDLPPAPPRDRDVLVLGDTSASPAGGPLRRARHLVEGLAEAAGPGDRVDVWALNLDRDALTRSLTGGFRPARSDAVRGAAEALTEVEAPGGAADLKAGLERALAGFDADPGRQRVVLYLGDGESAAGPAPLGEAARAELGARMGEKGVGFFAVPLGLRVDPYTLHGLAALTGGAVVRVGDDLGTARGRADAAGRLAAAFAVPVLRVDRVAFGPEVGEAFPARLPPLRADRATLVVGTLTADAPAVTARV